jgi:plastocyanin domain-containing protein
VLPGERVTLVFQGGAELGCCDQIVLPAVGWKGRVTPGKSVEATVTVPASGKLAITCSMNMCQGQLGGP